MTELEVPFSLLAISSGKETGDCLITERFCITHDQTGFKKRSYPRIKSPATGIDIKPTDPPAKPRDFDILEHDLCPTLSTTPKPRNASSKFQKIKGKRDNQHEESSKRQSCRLSYAWEDVKTQYLKVTCVLEKVKDSGNDRLKSIIAILEKDMEKISSRDFKDLSANEAYTIKFGWTTMLFEGLDTFPLDGEQKLQVDEFFTRISQLERLYFIKEQRQRKARRVRYCGP